MNFRKLVLGPILGLTAVIALGTLAVQAQEVENDCSNNSLQSQPDGNDECLALPPVQEATNLIGGLSPAALAGAGALTALAGGGGSTTSTTATTR